MPLVQRQAFSFSDTSNSWAKPYIEQLHNAGIINGTGVNQFKPNDHASRAEAVMMILRMLNVTLDLGLGVKVNFVTTMLDTVNNGVHFLFHATFMQV
nr:S-layer homology domain-containing protein [Cohnella sp. REN36]